MHTFGFDFWKMDWMKQNALILKLEQAGFEIDNLPLPALYTRWNMQVVAKKTLGKKILPCKLNAGLR